MFPYRLTLPIILLYLNQDINYPLNVYAFILVIISVHSFIKFLLFYFFIIEYFRSVIYDNYTVTLSPLFSAPSLPERGLGRFPPEVERGFVTTPAVLRSTPDVTSRPRADVSSRADVRVCNARGDVRPPIPVSLSAAMAAVPAMRPSAFGAGK